MHNKKAQIADSMTWIIATLIIIVILTISIFVVSPFGKEKKLKLSKTSDLLATKSLISYLQTNDFYEKISEEGELNKANGELALKIFKEFYEKEGEYLLVWFGTDLINDYFGNKIAQFTTRKKYNPYKVPISVNEEINLNKDNKLNLILTGD